MRTPHSPPGGSSGWWIPGAPPDGRDSVQSDLCNSGGQACGTHPVDQGWGRGGWGLPFHGDSLIACTHADANKHTCAGHNITRRVLHYIIVLYTPHKLYLLGCLLFVYILGALQRGKSITDPSGHAPALGSCIREIQYAVRQYGRKSQHKTFSALGWQTSQQMSAVFIEWSLWMLIFSVFTCLSLGSSMSVLEMW